MNTEKHIYGKIVFGKTSVFICCLCLWLISSGFSAQAQVYKNPVIAGDFPDPSVIRVGEDYYATATTGGWSPHFPILHSKDLINWQPVGAVFSEKPAWAKGDFWAPEIVEDKGRFFVFYTARRDEGKGEKGTLCIGVAVADKPEGVWQDKGALLCQEMGSIDADFVRDENDKPFLIWKEDGNDRQKPTWIYAQQLDESGTKLLGKPKKLFRNDAVWENHVVEGSFIVRRNGWFYHFYSGNACCGRSCNYALGVARSKTLLGKWEKNPQNPILAANENWQCPGHGSIVETPDGRHFLLYHAYRKNAVGFNIGREALLDEVKWTDDGWASINDGRGASVSAGLPFKDTVQIVQKTFLEEFSANRLALIWSQPLEYAGNALVKDGFLTLAPTEKLSSIEKMPETVIARRTVSGSYEATTRIDASALKTEGESAGISVYSWRGNAVGISFGGGRIFVWRRENDVQKETASIPLTDKKEIYLKIEAEGGEIFRFAHSSDGKNWESLGDAVGGSFVEGARVALVYNAKTPGAGARFDWIKIEQK